MLRRRWILQRPRHQQEIAGRIAQQLRRNVAGEGFVVHMAVRRSGDEKIIREILDRRDDDAGSRFPFNPANCSSLTKRFEKPRFLFDVEGPACTISKSAPQWLAKRLASAKHTGKRRRKRGSDTHVLVIHHFTNVVRFPRAPLFCEFLPRAFPVSSKAALMSAAPFLKGR
jgi:hypothetical protein